MIDNYISVIQKSTDFEGRSSRTEFWLFQLANIIIMIGLGALMSLLPQLSIILVGLYVLFFIGILLPSLSVGVRRLHDVDKSGWWLLIGLIPYIGSIILLIFQVLPSTPGDNTYGPNPYGATNTDSFPVQDSSEEEIIEVEQIEE